MIWSFFGRALKNGHCPKASSSRHGQRNADAKLHKKKAGTTTPYSKSGWRLPTTPKTQEPLSLASATRKKNYARKNTIMGASAPYPRKLWQSLPISAIMQAGDMTMATMNVSLPDPMKGWVEDQAQSGRYSNASDYVRDLIRRDQERAAKIAQMQRLVDEARGSGISKRSLADIRHAAQQQVGVEI
jgi:antitoxin ParD1/3/4